MLLSFERLSLLDDNNVRCTKTFIKNISYKPRLNDLAVLTVRRGRGEWKWKY